MKISSNERLLVVAAHPDDEVLGCGGTIAKFTSIGASVKVAVFADGVGSRFNLLDANHDIQSRKRRDDMEKAHKILGIKEYEIFDYEDNRFDRVPLLDLIKKVELILKAYSPTIVVTHSSSDLNIDHQRLHEACVCACRPLPGATVKSLFFFEVPSSTDWRPAQSRGQFSPSVYIDISDFITSKLESLHCYRDEMRDFPHSRSYDAILNLAKYRGASVGVSAAEAFECGRILA